MNKAQKALLTKGERPVCRQINYAWGFMVKTLKDELDGRCEECGCSDKLQGHHIVPKYLNGESIRDNTIMLCSDCHDKAHYRNGYSLVV